MGKGKKSIFKIETQRFHIEFGPASLFERVLYKMKDVHELKMEGEHYKQRVHEREIPEKVLEYIQKFDINDWELKTAEVRVDRGKFMNSTWEVVFNNNRYWVTIGLGNFIKTIVQKDTSGVEKCIRDGEFYDFVEEVNRKLMDAELVELQKDE